MRLPTASSGLVSTVLNTGGASAGSTYVEGFAVDSSNRVQMDTTFTAADVVRKNGIACKNTGVIYVATSGGTRNVNGLRLTDVGQLIVEEGATPAFWVNGLPVNSSGALCVSSIS